MKNEITKIKRSDESELVLHKWFNSHEYKKLVIFLPGYSYCSEAPAFFFLKKLLIEMEFIVISVEYRYNEIGSFKNLNDEEKNEYVKSDMKLLYDYIEKIENKESILVIGKSIGTIAQAFLNEIFNNSKIRNIWLTPILSEKFVEKVIYKEVDNSLIIIGENDPFCDLKKYKMILGSSSCEIMKDTDHGFFTSDSRKDIVNHNILLNLLKTWISPKVLAENL